MNRSSDAWRRAHGGMCEEGSIWGDQPVHRQCAASFCKARDAAGLSSHVFQGLRSFLLNICRLLRQQARTNKGHISAASRHLLFLIRVDGRARGWLVTNPHFKPLTFEGVSVDLPETLDVPFQVKIATMTSQSCGRNFKHFRFTTLDEVAKDLALMARDGQVNPAEWEWCQTAYKLYVSTPLSVLHVTDALNWVQMSAADFEHQVGDNGNRNDDDNDDDDVARRRQDQDDVLADEQGEINEMLSALTRSKSKCKAKSKSKPTSASSTFPVCMPVFNLSLES